MNKLTCPLCSNSVHMSPFKSWKFAGYDVRRYECPTCKANFNVYQSPKRTYTIPKPR